MLPFLRKKPPVLLGVDISSASIKLLELSRQKDCYQVECYGIEPLPPNAVVEKNIDNIEIVGKAVKKLVAKVKPHVNQAAVAVAGSAAITRIIEMDADLSDDERESQIRLEAEQYIPYPMEEVHIDFEVMAPVANDPARVNVLLAASRHENVDWYVDVLEIGGLVAKIVDVEAYAMERAFSLLSATIDNTESIIAIVDIGATMTTLTIMNNRTAINGSKIIYTREQLFGGGQLTNAIQHHYGLSLEKAMQAIRQGDLPAHYTTDVLHPFMDLAAQQVARALQFFFSSSAYNHVDHILLAGGTAAIIGLPALIQEKLGTPVTVANPFINMTLSPRINTPAITNDAPALMIACGLALRSFS